MAHGGAAVSVRQLLLSGGQHAELMAIGVGHHHPTDVASADVDASRPVRAP
jgi:hypothetical protein